MTTSDALRYTKIPTHGSGAIPAVGFGTLIPDRLATKRARHWKSDSGISIVRIVQGGDAPEGGPVRYDQAMEHESSPGAS
jgi:hypothetical protein